MLPMESYPTGVALAADGSTVYGLSANGNEAAVWAFDVATGVLQRLERLGRQADLVAVSGDRRGLIVGSPIERIAIEPSLGPWQPAPGIQCFSPSVPLAQLVRGLPDVAVDAATSRRLSPRMDGSNTRSWLRCRMDGTTSPRELHGEGERRRPLGTSQSTRISRSREFRSSSTSTPRGSGFLSRKAGPYKRTRALERRRLIFSSSVRVIAAFRRASAWLRPPTPRSARTILSLHKSRKTRSRALDVRTPTRKCAVHPGSDPSTDMPRSRSSWNTGRARSSWSSRSW